MGIKEMSEGRKDLFMLPPGLIQEDPGWNVRGDSPELQAHIRMLADSIREVGVQEPLTVYMRDGAPVLTNGHCRLLATRLAMSEGAEIKAVPVRVEEKQASEADRVLSLMTRNNGKPLTPLEQSTVVKRLLNFGWKFKEIASKTGLSVQYIDNLVTLGSAPEEVKTLVKENRVSATLAVAEVKKKGPRAAASLNGAVEKAKSQGKPRATAKDISEERSPAELWIALRKEIVRKIEKIREVCDIPLPAPGWWLQMEEVGRVLEKEVG